MIKEIQAASTWWGHQLSKSVSDPAAVSAFTSALSEILTSHCRNHWYEDDCERGSAYRALTFDVRLDPLLCQAAAAAGLSNPVKLLVSAAQSVMYINPGSVRVRSLTNHYVPAFCVYPQVSEVAYASPQYSATSPSSFPSPTSEAPNTPTSPDSSRAGSPSSSPSPSRFHSHHRSSSSDVLLPQSMYPMAAAAAAAVISESDQQHHTTGSGSNSPSSLSPRLPSHPGAPAALYSLQQYHPHGRSSPPNSGRPSRVAAASPSQQQQQQQPRAQPHQAPAPRRFQPHHHQPLRPVDVEANASISSFAMATSSSSSAPASSSPTATPQSGPAPSEVYSSSFTAVPVRAQVSVV